MGIVNRQNNFIGSTSAKASEVNEDFNNLYNEFNGGIDENNINFARAELKAEFLSALKEVDGTGSNLDADLLDGKEYSEIISETKSYTDTAETNANDYADTVADTAETNAKDYANSLVGAGVPPGIITLWSGSTTPTGWALCNGSNGTPDLRDRFVVGAGSSYSVGDTGGNDNVSLSEANLPSHDHSSSGLYTNSDGGHSHSWSDTSSSAGSHGHTGSTNPTGSHGHTLTDKYYVYGGSPGPGEGDAFSYTTTSRTTSSNGLHSHSLDISGNGTHSHYVSGNTDYESSHSHSISGSTGNAGSNIAHENRPPYYALAYIMKI
jgi:microcystin-dependent protein